MSVCIYIDCIPSLGIHASKAEEELFKYLFTGYNSNVRPVLNDTDSVNVTIGLTVSQIIDIVSSFLGCMKYYVIYVS